MSIKIYIDTNVYLNSIDNRDNEVSRNVLTFLVQKNIELYINDLTILNIHYIAKKNRSRDEIYKIVKTILYKHKVVPIDKAILEESLESNFKDFEDGVQYFCAKKIKADLIITSNKKDFIYSKINVLTPLEFYNKYII